MGEKRGRQERIDCLCGVTADTPAAEQYTGLWLQCDDCLSWLHGACVGYPKRAPKGAPTPLSCRTSSFAVMHPVMSVSHTGEGVTGLGSLDPMQDC